VSDEPRPTHERRAWRTDQQWDRLRERMDAAEPLPVSAAWWRRPASWIAAAAAVGLAVAGIRWQMAREATREVRSVSTAAGERLELRLADSSLVTLGPSTTLHYRSTRTRREAEVVGLAAFTIVHDSARPFAVHAKTAVATDIGTKFVVRAYEADSGVEVAVASGIVKLTSAVPSAPLYLRSGEVGRVTVAGAVTPIARANVERDTAWIDGRLAFDDQPLSDVAAELERWFDVEIQIPDQSLAKRRVSAVYNTPSLAGILDALTTTFGARVERHGRVVTIVPRTR
jgi:transmembrane sensor